jgi:hypothetical protein
VIAAEGSNTRVTEAEGSNTIPNGDKNRQHETDPTTIALHRNRIRGSGYAGLSSLARNVKQDAACLVYPPGPFQRPDISSMSTLRKALQCHVPFDVHWHLRVSLQCYMSRILVPTSQFGCLNNHHQVEQRLKFS